jgi:hypothetical protein
LSLRIGHNKTRSVAAVFAGALALPAAASAAQAPHAESNPAATISSPAKSSADDSASEECLADTICTIKDRVRWRTAAWKPQFCQKIARAILQSSERHQIPPALILAVMINESDMNETTFRTTVRNGAIYAKDGGLMGIRCIVDKKGNCTNAHVRGMQWKQVMEPTNNIELGARELAHYRDGGGVTSVTMRLRNRIGKIETHQKTVPCTHKTHAYWAHYNHGPRYIDHGSARHYPHRIGVLYYALARSLNADTTEVTNTRLTMIDPGKRPRTYDRPVEARYQKLCQAIRESKSACTGSATAALH